MSKTPVLRIPGAGDAGPLLQLLRHAPAGAGKDWKQALPGWLEDRCVRVLEQHGRPVAIGSIDLDSAAIGMLLIAGPARRRGLGRRLLVALERGAVSFGLLQLQVAPVAGSSAFFKACGYQPSGSVEDQPAGALTRRFVRRQTRYGRRIAGLLAQLGIPPDYGRTRRLALQPEPANLAGVGPDMLGRDQHLLPAAGRAWLRMQLQAMREGVDVQLVSAYRSVDHQAGIIRRKLKQGQGMEHILEVSAAPGYSEHHTGRAVDLSTAGCIPLEIEFEQTAAYAWLQRRARDFGFVESYPRGNRHGIAFEPWHWCYHPRPGRLS